MPPTPGTIKTTAADILDPLQNPSGSDVLFQLQNAGFSTLNEDIDFFSVSNFPIDSSLFYQILPYRFMILQASVDSTSDQPVYKAVSTFVLPIGPQSINIDMGFSALNTPLSDGMLVENNGATFREITIKTSTGFLPFRNTQANTYGNIFGQTQAAAKALINVANPTPLTNPIFDNSGYVHYQKLLQFLEAWAYASKNNDNMDLRLAFDMAKENKTYLVTPKMFSLQRDVDSPLEYKLDIALQAWKTINVRSKAGSTGPLYTSSPWLNPSSLGAIIADMHKAEGVLYSAINVIKAAVSDAESYLGAVRQVVLAVKNAINAVASLLDMPNAIVQGLAGSIALSYNDIKGAVDNFGASTNGAAKTLGNIGQIFQKTFQAAGIQGNLQSPTITASTGTASFGIHTTTGSNPTGSVKSGASSNINNPNNIKNPMSNPQSQLSGLLGDRGNAFELLSSINLNTLKNIPQSVQDQVDQEYAIVRNFTRQTFQNVRDRTNDISRTMAVYFGQDFPDYNKYYPSTGKKVGFKNKPLTRSQMDILSALRTIATNLDKLSSQNTYNAQTSATDLSFNYVGSLLQGTGIPFSESTSKYSAAVPFGMNLAQIANFYLGDPERSNEIIILNNLLPPFIQEEPFVQPLIVNATDQSFVVEDGSSLILNQQIILSSNVVNPFSVAIKGIKKINDVEWLITINSSVSLSNLRVNDAAKMEYFAPGTVSSRNTIFIPSSTVNLNNLPSRLKPITYAPNPNNLNSFSLIDFLLTTDNDLAIDANGSIGLSGGLVNLLQALKLKFLTVQGQNIWHSSYGAGVATGTPSSRINIPDLKKQFTRAIEADNRFAGVLSLSITLNNGVLYTNGTVSLTAVSQVLPFGWSINTN